MRRSRRMATAGVVLAAIGAAAAMGGGQSASAQTLYNGVSGGTPGSQGWLILGNVPPGSATESYNSTQKYTTLDSSASIAAYAGYSNYNVGPTADGSVFTPTTFVNSAFPTLDRTTGFTLHFTTQVLNENHSGTNGANRAGFSVLLLGNDKQGVEIGFQSGGFFSQSTSFTQAETDFNSTAASLINSLTSYDLSILGNTYTLSSGGTALLTGQVKDYTGASGFGTDVYRTSNFLFLGDDTTSAGAQTNLAAVSLTTVSAAAPEPGTAALVLLGLIGGPLAAKRRRG